MEYAVKKGAQPLENLENKYFRGSASEGHLITTCPAFLGKTLKDF